MIALANTSTFDREAYIAFLRGKSPPVSRSGFDLDPAELHPSLKPHQRDAVLWLLRGGRRAVFASFGLGKTRKGLETLRQLVRKLVSPGSARRQTMIIAPLGARREFRREARKMGLPITYVRNDAEAHAAGPLLITNYERVRDGHFTAAFLGGLLAVWLDEASCLRSYGSKTYQVLSELFEGVPYRYVATATPSPNRVKELIHYSAFLGIMDSGQALTRWFQRDSEEAGNLTLMEHKASEFWLWVSSWALFISKPSDLGHSDEGYDLPELRVHYHCVAVSHTAAGSDADGQGRLLREGATGVTEAAREKRDTIPARLAKVQEIMASAEPEPDGGRPRWLVWHHLEAERHAIEAAWAEERRAGRAATVYGSQDLEERETVVNAFAEGAWEEGPHKDEPLYDLASKPEILGSGTNLQGFCHRAIFMGIDYSANDFMQALHRLWRFGQVHPVDVHVVYADSEAAILRKLKVKWQEHADMVKRMVEIMRTYGLSDATRMEGFERALGIERREVRGERFLSVLNDTVLETAAKPDNSEHMIATSIPFADQYEYTCSYNDFGHNGGIAPFMAQLDFLIPELLRVLQPGRIAAIHVKDRMRYGSVTGLGMYSVDRFSDKVADAFERHGFIFCGRRTVVTDVVRENNQTYRLTYGEMLKDGTKMGVGMSEYVLLFRKPQSDTSRSYADVPVVHDRERYSLARWQVDAHGFARSSGDRLLRPEEIASLDLDTAKAWWEAYSRSHVYDYHQHIALGEELERRGRLPKDFFLLAPSSWSEEAWSHIQRMRTLNTEQGRKQQEQHVCPLQLDLIEGLIERYTNRGERVYDPFGGIGSVPYQAVKMGRFGSSTELHDGYWWTNVGYCRAAEAEATAPTLFDIVGKEALT
ncbi:MAG: DNA methyltransferase [Gemmatimonadota bacterium]